MIKVTDGTQVIVVTNGAFESIYKRLGFKPVTQVEEAAEIAQAASKAMEDHGVPYIGAAKEDGLTDVLLGLEDKPVEQWTKDECAAFVKAHSIDLGNARKESAIKAVIQNWISEQGDLG